MSKIQDQIKELQLKQKKLDYISYISDLLKNDTHCVDFKDVKDEILGKVDPFLLELIESIENGEVLKQEEHKQSSGSLSNDETTVLKALAAEAARRISGATPQTNSGKSPFSDGSPAPQKRKVTGNVDKMSFAMENRHLGGKRVQVINDKNLDLRGKVVGLDAPFVLVQTDTGPTIEVPLEKIVLTKE